MGEKTIREEAEEFNAKRTRDELVKELAYRLAVVTGTKRKLADAYKKVEELEAIEKAGTYIYLGLNYNER